jgi:hypothetical protein
MNERLSKFKGEKLLAEIEKSTDGLTYISETDAKVEAIFVDRDNAEKFLDSITNDDKSDPLDQSSFFDRITTNKEWFGPDETLRAKRFSLLDEILRANLHDLKLIRVGRVRIEIYVVGFDADGNLAGIKTKAVET